MEHFTRGWHQLFRWCQRAKDEAEFTALLDLLLTPDEKQDLAMRCLILQELLLQRHSQRDIAKQLNVSIAKITRGSNELKRVKASLIQFIRKHLLKS